MQIEMYKMVLRSDLYHGSCFLLVGIQIKGQRCRILK